MKYDIALNPLNLNIDYYIFSDKCETSSKKKKTLSLFSHHLQKDGNCTAVFNKFYSDKR